MTDNQTKSATTKSRLMARCGCIDCGWGEARDLKVCWVFGRLNLLCLNPWMCSQRQADLRGAFGLPLGLVEPPVTG